MRQLILKLATLVSYSLEGSPEHESLSTRWPLKTLVVGDRAAALTTTASVRILLTVIDATTFVPMSVLSMC